MKIYCGHPITGLSFEAIERYYRQMSEVLRSYGYEVFHPMVGKGYLRLERELKPAGYQQPLSTNHAIIERDRWMVMQSDVVYFDFTDATSVSIGCIMELAWAHDHGKHTVVVMGSGNPHYHAFVLEAADVLFETEDEAIVYLGDLGRIK
jgi:nucleoside 2-deoxyribosyltransferase